MHKLALLIIATSLSLLIGGCSGIPNSPPLEKNDSQATSQPEWINNPNKAGYQIAVGQANKATSNAERIAYLTAQAELAKQINIYIDTLCQSQQSSAITTAATIDCQSKHTSQQVMHQSEILEQWEDAQHLYILLGVANDTLN